MKNASYLVLFLLGTTFACAAGSNQAAAGSGGAANTGGAMGTGTTSMALTTTHWTPSSMPVDGGLPTNPLFSNGDDSVVDGGVCANAPIWILNETLDISTGLIVLLPTSAEAGAPGGGTLWQVTAPNFTDNFTLPQCTPPGTDWCVSKYQWKQVGTCP